MGERITIDHFRRAGICPDARPVFFVRHGLNWKDFVRNGIDSDVLRATGDHLTMIERLEGIARSERRGQE